VADRRTGKAARLWRKYVRITPQSLSRRRPPDDAGGPEDAAHPRETDIVRLVGKGLGNKEIASKLGVSVTTVRSHLNSVYDKLGPASRVELALLAARRP
jgi:DNA-binding NarL/FixJ family response regulator